MFEAKARVADIGDLSLGGTVLRPGEQVSEVRFDNGATRYVTNTWLRPFETPVLPELPAGQPTQESDPMAMSKAFTVKSNARRAARQAKCDPESVVPVDGGFAFDDATSSSKSKAPKAAKAKAPTKAKTKTAKAKAKPAAKAAPKAKPARTGKAKTKAPGKTGAKPAMVLEMILKPGGANLNDICTATGWLPHTARARISGIVAANNLKIERTRLLGVSIYQAKREAA